MWEQVDLVIESEECPAELARCLEALFGFEPIKWLERAIRKCNCDPLGLQELCLRWSLESRVLCSETAFVGFTEKKHVEPKSASGFGS
jgi:hypothetical protein